MSTLGVPIVRLAHGADLDLPAYATAHAAGLDLMAALDQPITLAAGAARWFRPASRLRCRRGLRRRYVRARDSRQNMGLRC